MSTPSVLSGRASCRAVAPAPVLVVIMVATLLVSVHQAPRADALSSFDQELLGYINEHRANRGLQPFAEYGPFSDAAQAWSTTMRDGAPAPCNNPGGALRHDSLARISTNGVPPGTTSAGENIAWTCGPRGQSFAASWTYGAMPSRCRANLDFTSALVQFCQWIDSTGHREAIENPNYRWIGLGSAERSSGGLTAVFSTARFSTAPAASVFYLNFDWDNQHDVRFDYGTAADPVLIGDWEGDGADEVALRRGTAYLMDYDNDGRTDQTIHLRRATGQSLSGDWDGDGIDEVAIRSGNTYYLDFGNGGAADRVVQYGRSSDEVFAGDWDGDGVDELAIRRGNRFYLNFDFDHRHDLLVSYGRSTDLVFVGDWDGDGVDELGMRRGNRFYLNFDFDNRHDLLVNYGRPSDMVIPGDWDGDGVDELGIRR